MYQLDRKTAGGSPAEPFGLLAGSTTGFGSGARQLMNRRGHWTSEPFLDRDSSTDLTGRAPPPAIAMGNGQSYE
ncbi:MAG: hypothetical protein M3N47_03930 [Chloroflexota bacterium]|nr:hypothetical protein [Chloroflexota bacterium]